MGEVDDNVHATDSAQERFTPFAANPRSSLMPNEETA